MNIRLISISDLHLGHNKVTANIIHHNLRQVLYPKLTSDLDLLNIGGDFFDTLIHLDGKAGYVACTIINELLVLAKEHEFYIRVLRGTFSHDRMQNQIFTAVAEEATLHALPLVRVIDTVTIERIDPLDIDILYIPDDLPTNDGMTLIRQCMEDVHLAKVDFVFSHGYFEHLLPIGIPHKPVNTFSPEVFDKFTKGCVCNGHIHTPSVVKKVISHGSFERLCHGEEEDKGFFTIDYDTVTNETTIRFINNPYATIFKTIHIDSEIPNIGKWCTEYIGTIISNTKATHPTQFIRLAGQDKVLISALVLYIKQTYPTVQVTILADKHTKATEEEIITTLVDLPIITEQNLPERAVAFLAEEHDIHLSADRFRELLS